MIIQNENMMVAFVNSEQQPIKTEHICYYTLDDGDKIKLEEVYLATYPHPEAPDQAIIQVMQTMTVRTTHRLAYDAGHMVLMEANQKTCRNIEKCK